MQQLVDAAMVRIKALIQTLPEQAVDTSGTLGTVVNNGNGTFSYDANGQFEALAAGETTTDTFSYTVTDNNGLSSTEVVHNRVTRRATTR